MKTENLNHEFFMQRAIALAKEAAQKNEVPIGAVLVDDKKNTVIAEASNSCEQDQSALSHAEIKVITDATKSVENWRLTKTRLYVTLEPCPMCLGAIIQARIPHLIFACSDTKRCADSFFKSLQGYDEIHDNNHSLSITAGVLASDTEQLLKDFFKEKRQRK